MNNIIAIGWTGIMVCYLNITKEEAIKRYCKDEECEPEGLEVKEIVFNTRFEAYDLWESEPIKVKK